MIKVNATIGEHRHSASMKRARAIAQATHAVERRWVWLVLALAAAIAILLAAGHAAPAHAASADMGLVAAASDGEPDCDEEHGPFEGHCHISTACFAHGQLIASDAADDHVTANHPQPIAEGLRLGRTPAPDPQPPKHSSQA